MNDDAIPLTRARCLMAEIEPVITLTEINAHRTSDQMNSVTARDSLLCLKFESIDKSWILLLNS